MSNPRTSSAAQNNVVTASKNFTIVGIGASAGGLEAIGEMLENLLPDTGMAFVIVQHLDPTHESRIDEIFSKKTLGRVIN